MMNRLERQTAIRNDNSIVSQQMTFPDNNNNMNNTNNNTNTNSNQLLALL